MTPCNCIVQEGQVSAALEARLRSGLNELAVRAFGSEAEITWRVVPRGNGFTAGEPTKASVVSFRAHEPLAQSRREEVLRELCDFWIGETGCSVDELVGVVSDPQQA
ncbi:MAG: hypothetical protein AAGA81_03220 [Acidobacteriota bacterium]